MSKELVFNVSNIFNSKTPEGALYQYESKKYFIAPYQRGYKWASKNPNDAVCLLMKDLFDATESESGEYYLQFITTKRSSFNGIHVLEVIDGQQRLTTLTILLSVLSDILQTGQAPSNYLLSYEVRPKVSDFFQTYIYSNINTLFLFSWEEFIKLHPDMNEQDIFYLFTAVKKIKSMLDEICKNNNDVLEFQSYVLENVKIILNNIERDVSCEELFGNLNDNKIELLSAELIKGLLLTTSAREKIDLGKRVNYKELLEIRSVMGRQWDEISIWANRQDIKMFFFESSTYVLDEMLLLLAQKDGYQESKAHVDKTDVFNYIQANIRKGKKRTGEYFEEFKNLKYILNEWFLDDEIYNSLGYLFFSKTSKKKIKDYLPLLEKSKTEIKTNLKKQISDLLISEIDYLEYGQNNSEIYNILLAISVFSDKSRFDFTSFNNQSSNWSLEHIFPQNPEAMPETLGRKDLELINALASDKLESYKTVEHSLTDYEELFDLPSTFRSLQKKLLAYQGNLTTNEKTILYRIIKSDKLNSIGNMVLLKGPDNSSNGNGMFDMKRHNIVKRVSTGSFVPKHTYDVFSKLISSQMTPDLNVWTENDIDTHTEWIKLKIAAIKN